MTQFPDLFAALAAPFDPREALERDADRAGRRERLKYVRAQVVKNRLDSVLGPENWWPDYAPLAEGVECRLTIRLPDGSTAHRVDAGSGKDVKAAYSDALKRAAEGFGVGRYLRGMGVPHFGAEPPAPAAEAPAPPGDARPPGPRFLDWLRAEGRRHDVDLLNHISAWGRDRGYPSRVKDWDQAQVKAGFGQAGRKLAPALTNGRH